MMAQGRVFVHLLLLCVWCIDTKFQGVNAQNVTISKVQPDDPVEGGTVDLRCNTTNLEPGNYIEWSRLYMNNKVIIRDNTKYTRYTESSSEQSVIEILKINELNRDDAGTYYCTVKHSEGDVEVETASIYLTVLYLPSAQYPLCTPNGPFTVQEGTTHDFTCATERGSPPVSILIRKNNADIPYGSSFGNATTLTRLHTFTFTEDDNGISVECEIISLPFQRSCTFGPITVTMRDNRETQLTTTVENSPTPEIDVTNEGLDTSYPTWTGTTSGSSQITQQSTNLRPETVNPTLTPGQETVNPTTPSQETVYLTTPSQETGNPTTPSQDTSNPSTPSQETSKPPTPSQKTPNLPVVGLPIVLIAVFSVGGLICLSLLILLIVCYCFKKKPKTRQPQINLPLFQPTTDLVFEPQGSHHAIHQESTNLDKVDTTEKDDTSEELGADQNWKPEVMSVSHSPSTEPEDKRSATDVDKKNINTFKSQPELTSDTGDSKEGQEEVLCPQEPHKSTPTTGEIVYSEVSSQQRVPQVSSASTTYADLDLPPCTSDTVPLPKDQTFYAQISNL